MCAAYSAAPECSLVSTLNLLRRLSGIPHVQHQNTNPEDITICEAYIAFLESGNMDDFWRVAWDNGRITRETLANMDQVAFANNFPLHCILCRS